MKGAKLQGLYVITPDWTDTPRLIEVTEAILRGGCRIVQYRNKTTTPCHRDEQMAALRGLTRRFDALLIVNDDIDLALVCEADGVHLGSDDGDLVSARERLGPDRLLGASCYRSLELAKTAAQAGVDYVAFGSFFLSPTKPEAERAGPELIAPAKAATGLPVCAIGGITLDNAAPLVAAGADLLAVITAVYNSPNPERAARAFCQLYESQKR